MIGVTALIIIDGPFFGVSLIPIRMRAFLGLRASCKCTMEHSSSQILHPEQFSGMTLSLFWPIKPHNVGLLRKEIKARQWLKITSKKATVDILLVFSSYFNAWKKQRLITPVLFFLFQTRRVCCSGFHLNLWRIPQPGESRAKAVTLSSAFSGIWLHLNRARNDANALIICEHFIYPCSLHPLHAGRDGTGTISGKPWLPKKNLSLPCFCTQILSSHNYQGPGLFKYLGRVLTSSG